MNDDGLSCRPCHRSACMASRPCGSRGMRSEIVKLIRKWTMRIGVTGRGSMVALALAIAVGAGCGGEEADDLEGAAPSASISAGIAGVTMHEDLFTPAEPAETTVQRALSSGASTRDAKIFYLQYADGTSAPKA